MRYENDLHSECLKEIARIYSKKSSEIIFIKKFGYT